MEKRLIVKASFSTHLRRLPFSSASSVTSSLLIAKLAALFNIDPAVYQVSLIHKDNKDYTYPVTESTVLDQEIVCDYAIEHADHLLLRAHIDVKPPTPTPIVEPTAVTVESPQEEEPAQESAEESQYIHPHIQCDVCYGHVAGKRWKCQHCRDYDMCNTCFSTRRAQHSHVHQFKCIEYTGFKPKSTPAVSVVSATLDDKPIHVTVEVERPPVHMATCDFCDTKIVGVRHKCLQCPDFDLCTSCLPLASSQHPHAFVHVQQPEDLDKTIIQTEMWRYRAHKGVVCDACEHDIVGVRYKCGNCADYDLCENCEALPTEHPIHDPTHVFLKIKQPVQAKHYKYALLPNLYDVKAKVKRASTVASSTMTTTPSTTTVGTMANIPVDVPLVRNTVPNHKTIAMSDCGSVKAISSSVTSPMFSPTVFQPLVIQPLPQAIFISDRTIPDGTILAPGERFTKCWLMENTGDVAWPEGTVLKFVDGDWMGVNDAKDDLVFHVSNADKNDQVVVEAELRAPTKLGRSISYWRLVHPDGEAFGDRVWCEIDVLDHHAMDTDDEDNNQLAASSTLIFPVLQRNTTMETDVESITTSVMASEAARMHLNLMSDIEEDLDGFVMVDTDEEDDA